MYKGRKKTSPEGATDYPHEGLAQTFFDGDNPMAKLPIS
jgi:hypothetical protein